jgi:hypothetical protein
MWYKSQYLQIIIVFHNLLLNCSKIFICNAIVWRRAKAELIIYPVYHMHGFGVIGGGVLKIARRTTGAKDSYFGQVKRNK